MSLLLDSFRKNAAAAHAEASSAILPQVRDRAARAAARWDEMTERQERMEEMQRERDRAKIVQ